MFNNSYLALTLSVQIYVSENGDTFMNKCCSDLQYRTKIQNISKNGNDKKRHLSTYKQLDNRIHHVCSLLSANQLRELNNNKKLARISKSMELHKCNLLLIKENLIPKLHELVKVAINNKRGIQYILS